MDTFKCRYIKHENEEIIGFCLNQNCQNSTQYCYKCLNINHSEHFNDCIRFTDMIQIMDELMQVYNQLRKQVKDISKQLENLFEQIFKKMDQEIKMLENMISQLQNKDYLIFKSQIHLLKQFYSKQKENEKCILYLFITEQQIIKLNNINNTIMTMVSAQTQLSDKIDTDHQNDSEIVENNFVTESKQELNIQEAKKFLNEGNALYNLNKNQEANESYDKAIFINPKYELAWNNKGNALLNLNKNQEAIECYEKAISINPKYDDAWVNKGNALKKINKYYEAIECYDKAISINPKQDLAWNNKGNALFNLDKDQEAIECCDKAISINPKYDNAWSNKGFALHSLKKYKDAIICYDQALSISITPLRLQRKADSLFELGNKQEAKEIDLDALQKGSNQKDYIQKQLSKL